MKITITFLKERYKYWLDKIHEVGIWNKYNFLSVDICIRYNSKSLAGLFHRKYLTENSNFKNKIIGINDNFYDRLIIYENKPDYSIIEIDNVLVHEMIHQYIIQSKIKDTSTHGEIFHKLMNKINCYFFGDLNITISSKMENLNPQIGSITHKILIIGIKNDFFACKIKLSKIYIFNDFILKNQKKLNINMIKWYESKNTYFNNFRECTKKIHGIKKPISELKSFCETYNIIEKPIIEDL